MRIKGKPVVDATEPLSIEILPTDSIAGKSRKAHECAAAVAIKRQVACLDAEVHLTMSYIEEEKRVLRFMTPGALRTEIVGYDRVLKLRQKNPEIGAMVFQPGVYTLKPPVGLAKLENIPAKNRSNNDPRVRHDTNSTGRRRKHHKLTGVRPTGMHK